MSKYTGHRNVILLQREDLDEILSMLVKALFRIGKVGGLLEIEITLAWLKGDSVVLCPGLGSLPIASPAQAKLGFSGRLRPLSIGET